MNSSTDPNGEAKFTAVTRNSGSTSAVTMLSTLILGTLENIKRPAFCSMIPTNKGFCVMLDLGANKEIWVFGRDKDNIIIDFVEKNKLGKEIKTELGLKDVLIDDNNDYTNPIDKLKTA